jgi:hypothetical protein
LEKEEVWIKSKLGFNIIKNKFMLNLIWLVRRLDTFEFRHIILLSYRMSLKEPIKNTGGSGFESHFR